MLVFVESPLFSKVVYDYLTDEEYAEMQAFLGAHPESGALVKGSGGVRKARWTRPGSGKSGGVRVLYYLRTLEGEIWLLVIYAKSARDSIPGHVLKALKKEMEDASD